MGLKTDDTQPLRQQAYSSASDPRPTREVSAGEKATGETHRDNLRQWVGLAAGLVLSPLMYFVLMPDDVGHHTKLTAAVAALMATWWMTQALPLPVTALIPLAVFPLFNRDEDNGAADVMGQIGSSYGNPIIFLFMGGFMLALAMQRWNLHKRLALLVIRAIGTKPTSMIAGFMIATALISMWVSNTATAVMMLPIGVSVLVLVAKGTDLAQSAEKNADEKAAKKSGKKAARSRGATDGAAHDQGPAEGAEPAATVEDAPEARPDPGSDTGADADLDSSEAGFGGEASKKLAKTNFGTALMLGIAYAASIGSLGTIISTPPNVLFAAHMREVHDVHIGFGEWMMVGVPLGAVFLLLAWFLLAKVLFRPEIKEIPGGREMISEELTKLGPMSRGEKLVLAIFILAAASWVGVPLIFPDDPPISEHGIAIVIALLLFITPAGAERGVRLLDWSTANNLPWGVLLLFGGGLALSSQFTASGLSEWIGQQVEGLAGVPVWLMVLVICAGVLVLTELSSNTATAAALLPVAGGVAIGLGMDPLLLAFPVAVAATCSFMLPVATPPNAIAYGSGYVTAGQMIRGGFWLNIIALGLVSVGTLTLATWVFGIAW